MNLVNDQTLASFRCFSVISWNVRGLGDPDKCKLVRNVFLNANPVILCIQESMLSNVDFFKAASFLPPGFLFASSPADGSRGGMITAWDPNVFTLKNQFCKPYTIACTFTCNLSDLDFSITNTYGPSDHAFSLPYLQHLFELPNLIPGPWILLGDFNLVRQPSDKNNGQINSTLANAFNSTILQLCVSEIELSDRLYTWSNLQPFPILARLDRVFTNNDLNSLFPLTTLSSLPRPTSDHTPLLLTLNTEIPKAQILDSKNIGCTTIASFPLLLRAGDRFLILETRLGKLSLVSSRLEPGQRSGLGVPGHRLLSLTIVASSLSFLIFSKKTETFHSKNFRCGKLLEKCCSSKSD
jgi:exonuclease III